ncbi:MAG: polyprenyl synthetase family protein, partial [Actinomycetaceae bacterium]|nr:polyprenyl synthetase family protein [Actinomycetaceae bacterium]
MKSNQAGAQSAFDQKVFAAALHRKTLDFFDAHAATMGVHPELNRFLAFARSYVGGGKALRALGISVGNHIAGGEAVGTYAPATDLGVAIELYQASALVHDDLIDNADTRRGIPAVHRQAEQQLGAESAAPVAILIGDLLLSLNQLATVKAVENIDADVATNVLAYMARVTGEVAWGQYLDVITEQHPLTDPEALRRYVYDVIALKSGHYSVMRPLVLGALLQRPEPDFVQTLEKIGRAWGVAFQMRDDYLGVFGDEALTGKPTGSDIKEGKRTILLTMALSNAEAGDREFIEESLGRADLSDADLARVTRIIEESGAHAQHEQAIENLANEGRKLVLELGLDEEREAALNQFGSLLLDRCY